MGEIGMSLKDELAQAIDEWIQNRRRGSVSLLAKLSGVSYNTVLRIAQKEVEPSFKAVALMLRVLMPKEKYGDKGANFLVKHFPETGYFLEKDGQIDVEELDEIVRLDSFNREEFIALSIVATSDGASKDRIVAKLGEKGHASLEKLENAGIIFEYDGRYFASKKRFKIPGTQRILTEIRWLTELYDEGLDDCYGSYFRLKTEGLSDEGVMLAHKILDEASDKLSELIHNPTYHGPNVMGYGLVSTYVDAPKGGVK
jgi:transcriptional regulator with XRE-family HTH domain